MNLKDSLAMHQAIAQLVTAPKPVKNKVSYMSASKVNLQRRIDFLEEVLKDIVVTTQEKDTAEKATNGLLTQYLSPKDLPVIESPADPNYGKNDPTDEAPAAG